MYGLIGRFWLYAASIGASLIFLSGCNGLQVFGQTVAPGDTVALAIGWRPDVSRDQAEIVIQDSVGTLTLPASDPSIRNWMNVYPDPVSKLVVGTATQQDLGVSALSWGFAIDSVTTNGDKDWFETVIFLDLPPTIAEGPATIDVRVGGVSILPQPVALNVLSLPPNSPNLFETWEYGNLSVDRLLSMERMDHYTVTFDGSVVPAAIQLDLSHNPDKDNGGPGQAYVVPPRGDLRSFNWTDTGTTMRVLITPTWNKTPEDISRTSGDPETLKWFKFYVAGGIAGLQIDSVQAFDSDGNPVPGITAMLQ